MKKPKKGWADRRFANKKSFTRNSVAVRRAEPLSTKSAFTDMEGSFAEMQARFIEATRQNNVSVESTNDEFNDKTGYFVNKGQKNGRCNRTACQRRIGAHPELDQPTQQWVMRASLTAGDQLFYCSACARLFLESDERFGASPRVSLYIEDAEEAA